MKRTILFGLSEDGFAALSIIRRNRNHFIGAVPGIEGRLLHTTLVELAQQTTALRSALIDLHQNPESEQARARAVAVLEQQSVDLLDAEIGRPGSGALH